MLSQIDGNTKHLPSCCTYIQYKRCYRKGTENRAIHALSGQQHELFDTVEVISECQLAWLEYLTSYVDQAIHDCSS
jgi:hypothetical protein